MNLVIIPSIIKCINKHLSYTNTRSVYTPYERYEQLLITISSIKEKIPNCYIVVLECSKDIEDYEKVLISTVNEYINYYYINQDVKDAVESLYKGFGESFTIYTFLKNHFKTINETYNRYENIFKISGRYFLNAKFDYNKFNNDENNFRYFPQYNNVTTRLYKINKKYLNVYISNFISIMKECLKGKSIEAVIISNLPYKHIDYLGVSGYIAVTMNEFMDE